MYKGEERKLLQFIGNAPLEVTKYTKDVLRCNFCQREFMSDKNVTKWTNSARSTIIIQKVMGMPWHRFANIQKLYGTPVATSTMWNGCASAWNECGSFILNALVEELSAAKLMHVDDTAARILTVISANKHLSEKDRRACHTTTICATRICPKTNTKSDIRLYITDNKYAGENIAPILDKRYLDNPDHYVAIVADACNQNIPHIEKELLKKVMIAGCLVHARRKFFELLDFWPKECKYFLERVAQIYRIENECNHLPGKQRLKYHKKHSSIHMKEIYKEIRRLFEEKIVEPNCDLGKAMNYWLRAKKSLTMFLRVKGIELDNNKAERSLKTIIVQRKNSLFFFSRNSAAILSGFTSIVATCHVNNINAHKYLIWVQDNWLAVQENPKDFLPWKYQAMIIADKSKVVLSSTHCIESKAMTVAA